MEYEIRTEGLTDFDVRMRATGDEYRDKVRRLVHHAAKEAGTYMTQHVPVHSGRLRQAINVSQPVFQPGGAGGGGTWSARVGVDSQIAPHAAHVIYGTGMHGIDTTTHFPIFSNEGFLISGATRAERRKMKFPKGFGVMGFEKEGEGTVFTRRTEGQEAQTEWYAEAMRKAERVIKYRISRL